MKNSLQRTVYHKLFPKRHSVDFSPQSDSESRLNLTMLTTLESTITRTSFSSPFVASLF